MPRWHVMMEAGAACGNPRAELMVAESEFRKRIDSDQCQRCKRKIERATTSPEKGKPKGDLTLRHAAEWLRYERSGTISARSTD